MYRLFGQFHSSFESSEQRARRKAREKEVLDRRLATDNLVDWSPDIKWQKEMNIRAASYTPLNLFPEIGPSMVSESKGVLSPNGKWRYSNLRLQRGMITETYQGARRGTAVFDGPVIVPALFDTASERNPLMSLTVMELLTLRTGTRKAHGTTIVAGLGLGHQLIEISKRRSVKRLILVERSMELYEWLMPRIAKHLARQVDEFVCGDAFEVMPKLEADSAIVDIFPGYGYNNWDRDRLVRSCKRIKDVWCWGAANIGSNDYY